ncbi:hypothetical protein JST97_24790 [bacterium]|nr:hypothetical protein [bacterium]
MTSKEGPTRGERAARRWAIKRLGKVLLGVGGLGLLGLGGLHWVLQHQIPDQMLRAELEKGLGYPVRYSSAHLSWDARLVLDQVELLDPEGKAFLKMQVAELDFDRSLALRGQVVLQRLLLDHPDLELSGARWKLLTSKSSGPSKARKFPLVLRSLDMRWLDQEGKTAWQIRDWQGSFPPVPAGHWRLDLQGPQQELLEAGGGQGKTDLKLTRFPVARLATVATGAQYPNLEESAQVDLSAHLESGTWHVQSQLRSAQFTGPLELELDSSRNGRLTSAGGELAGLGPITNLDLPFRAVPQGWKIGPARMGWHGASWQLRGQVENEDQFEGDISCADYPFAWPGGLSSRPGRLKLYVQGGALKRWADFQLELSCQQLRVGQMGLGDWKALASGRLDQSGLPGVKWRLIGPQGAWPGKLAWESRSGDLRLDFDPLELARFLPGWSGRLQGRIERHGASQWDLELSLPLLSGPGLKVERARLRLAGSPPTWNGSARLNGTPLTLAGPMDAPVARAKYVSQRPDLKGWLELRLALVSNQLRLQVDKQKLSWRGVALPEWRGVLLGDRRGWKSDHLELAWPAFKLPLEVTGGWSPSSWRIEGTLKSQPLTSLASAVGSSLTGVSGQASGKLQASMAGVKFAGEVKALKQADRDLGNWQVELEKKGTRPARLQLRNQALKLPDLGTWQAQLDWQEGRSKPKLSLSAPALKLGAIKLGATHLSVQWDPSGSSLVDGQLGGLSVAGWVDSKKKTLALQGKVSDLNLAGLTGLPPATAGKLRGQWRAQGGWASPALEMSGQALGLSVFGSSLGDLTVHASHQGAQSKITVGPILVQQISALRTKLPSLKGQLTADFVKNGEAAPTVTARLESVFLNDRVVPDASLRGLIGSTGLSQVEVNWQVTPPLVLTGQIGLITRLAGELQGQSLDAISAGQLPLQGQAFGKFTYSSGLVFDGDLRNLVVAGQRLGQGRLTLAWQDQLHVEGSDFQALGVGLLQQRYPGLQASLSFQCDGRPSALLGGLKLRNGQWRGRGFPEVTVEAKGDGVSWLLEKVEVGLTPVLSANGRMWPATSRLELRGQLAGQSLAELALLGGGQAPADLSAHLFGDYQLSAQQQQVALSFQGQARDLAFRGVDLGTGQLQMRADPGLEGELELQQPLEISRIAEVPAGLRSVLPAAGILGAIRLRGVKLAGTLDSPSVSPVWAAPQIRLRLPFP